MMKRKRCEAVVTLAPTVQEYAAAACLQVELDNRLIDAQGLLILAIHNPIISIFTLRLILLNVLPKGVGAAPAWAINLQVQTAAIQAQIAACQAQMANGFAECANSSVLVDAHALHPLQNHNGLLPQNAAPAVWFPATKGDLVSATNPHLDGLMLFYALQMPPAVHHGESNPQRKRRAIGMHIGLR